MTESRVDLLRWVNELCQLNYSKIEQCGTGAAYCSIINSIYGDIPLVKVKFDVKGEHESIGNFKILQTAFTKHKIDKMIPVDKLIKMKMQDNLEFVQWIKKFWVSNIDPDNMPEMSAKPPQTHSSATTAPRTPSKVTPRRKPVSVPAPAPVPTRAPTRPAQAPAPATRNGNTSRVSNNSVSSNRPASAAKIVNLQKEIDHLTSQLLDMQITYQTTLTERTFYYGKLTEIEKFLQTLVLDFPEKSEDQVVKDIQDILYQTNVNYDNPEEEQYLVDDEDNALGDIDLDDVLMDEDFEDLETY